IGKEEQHVKPSRPVRQLERLEVRALEVGVAALAVHHSYGDLAAVGERKGHVRSQVRLERLRPGSVEIDRINEDGYRLAVVAVREYRGNLSGRLLAHPCVHICWGAGD